MNLAEATNTAEQEMHFPIECEGEAGYLAAGPACKPQIEPGGMSITDDDDRHAAWSNREFRTPFILDAMLKTDSTNIRLKYGTHGNVILNWEVQPGTLILSNPVTEQEIRIKEAGTVPTDTWVHVQWTIDEGRMTLVIDDVERFTMKGNFAGMSKKIAIGAGWGSRVTIKSFRVVERPRGMAFTEGLRLLHGLEPDEQAPGFLGCLKGVLHYWNRLVSDPKMYALAGGAGRMAVDREISRKGGRKWGQRLLDQYAQAIGIVAEQLGKHGDLKEEIRQSVDDGRPCLIFDEEMEDFALLVGYHDNGCIVRTSGTEAERSWNRFEDSGHAVYRLAPGNEKDAYRALCDMMIQLSEEMNNPSPASHDLLWGTSSLDACLRFVESGAYDMSGLAYFADFWSKCRSHTAEFLYEISGFSGGAASLIEEAAGTMEAAGSALEQLHRMLLTDLDVDAAIALLTTTRDREEQSTAIIRKIVSILSMRKELPSYQFTGFHMSRVGAMRACLDLHQAERISNAWLFGATGYAFLMAIDEDVTNRAPNFGLSLNRIHRLAANIGLHIQGIRVHTDINNHDEWRRKATEGIRQAIDAGLPCFGQGLAEQTETEVLFGYEPQGFLTHGWHQRGLVIPWEALGAAYCPCEPCSARRKEQSGDSLDVKSGFIDIHWADAVQPSDVKTTLKEAFAYILEQNSGSSGVSQAGYRYGIAAYKHWIHVVKEGNAIGFYVGYLCDVWRDCRSYAAPFLREAASKLGPEWTETFEEAARHYDAAANKWKQLNDMYPWMQPHSKIVDVEKRLKTVELLEGILESEAAGLRMIEEIYRKM